VQRHRPGTIAGFSRRGKLAVLLACAAALCGGEGIAGGLAYAAVPPSASAASGSWTVYHGDPAGTGVAPPARAVEATTVRWTTALDGQIHGGPRAYAGQVYVATENAGRQTATAPSAPAHAGGRYSAAAAFGTGAAIIVLGWLLFSRRRRGP